MSVRQVLTLRSITCLLILISTPALADSSQTMHTQGVITPLPGTVRPALVPGAEPCSHEAGPTGLSSPARTSGIPGLLSSYSGIYDTGHFPANPDLAVGREYMMQVMNSAYAVIHKCGGIAASGSLASFANEYTHALYSPRVVYDPLEDRWLFVFLLRNDAMQKSELRIYASQTPDPRGEWWAYTLLFVERLESAEISVTPNAGSISFERYSFTTGNFIDSYILYFDNIATYSGLPTSTDGWFNIGHPNDGTKAQHIRPATMHTFTGTQWFVSAKDSGATFLSWYGVTGIPHASALTPYDVGTSVYGIPPNHPQPDASLVDAGDCRIGSAVVLADTLWVTYTSDVSSVSVGIKKFIVSTRTQARSDAYTGSGIVFAYPGFDVDNQGRGVMCFNTWGTSQYLSASYTTYQDGWWGGSPFLHQGSSNYSDGGGAPWQWGGHMAVARDPVDNSTMWMTGTYADSLGGSQVWATWIGAVSHDPPGELSSSPDTVNVTALPGGPTWPDSVDFYVENTGGSALNWAMSYSGTWLEPLDTEGVLTPGAIDTVTVRVYGAGESPGVHYGTLTFSDCGSAYHEVRYIVLTVGTEGMCAGATVEVIADLPLFPPTPTYDVEMGMFINAIEEFQLCAIGMKVDLTVPQTVHAYVYEANGLARGPLLAEGSYLAVDPGHVTHFVPVDIILEACRDYDIAFHFENADSFGFFIEPTPPPIFDVGPIRVVDGEVRGAAAGYALPFFTLIGTPTSCGAVSDLSPLDGAWPQVTGDPSTERGVFVTAMRTMNVCAIGWEADYPTPVDLSARVYTATGATRGDLIATGSTIAEPTGLQVHSIPLSVTLHEGFEYDIEVVMPPSATWSLLWEDSIALPFLVDDAILVRNGEQNGDASNLVLGHFTVGWSPFLGGGPFNLAKPGGPYPPPNSSTQPNTDHGVYVTSLKEMQVYSVAWNADLPPGAPIGARIFEASGTTRGALIAQGWTASGGVGMRWHDIPITASLQASADYDIEIDVSLVNSWRWWNDEAGLPYTANGVIRVNDGEQEGDANNVGLIELQVNGCDNVLTAVTPGPITPPKFFLSAPYPNPSDARSTIAYSIDEPGAVTIIVYDVAGRHVATLLGGHPSPAGPGRVELNAARLPAGVYFVKLVSGHKSVARKITIVR